MAKTVGEDSGRISLLVIQPKMTAKARECKKIVLDQFPSSDLFVVDEGEQVVVYVLNDDGRQEPLGIGESVEEAWEDAHRELMALI